MSRDQDAYRECVANAIRGIADRVERGEVLARTAQSFFESIHPILDVEGNIESTHVEWSGHVSVELPADYFELGHGTAEAPGYP